MQNEFKAYQARWTNFNRWESAQLQKRSSREKFDQFLWLFNIGQIFPTEVIEKCHTEHLKSIILKQESRQKTKKSV